MYYIYYIPYNFSVHVLIMWLITLKTYLLASSIIFSSSLAFKSLSKVRNSIQKPILDRSIKYFRIYNINNEITAQTISKNGLNDIPKYNPDYKAFLSYISASCIQW